jgi:hypothetical protein
MLNKVDVYLFTKSVIEVKLESLGLLDLVAWKERGGG